MRILHGANVIQAPPGWRAQVLALHKRVVIDVGSGDGRWAYESARREPSTHYVALDPDAAALAQYAYRASRKPARGGVANATFVVAAVEDPPPELHRIATHVGVVFPWAALLRGLLRPDPATLRGLKTLAQPDATFEITLTYDASHDHGASLPPEAPDIDAGLLDSLRAPYADQGLTIDSIESVTRADALAIPSTWGRRLLHGRNRDVWQLVGHFP